MDPALIGLIGMLFGGVILKVVEHFLNRGKVKDDVAAGLREEMRRDIKELRTELREESKESDEWKSKYWELKSELLIVNHKTNEAIKVVDDHHKEDGLGERLTGLENPGK